jgi:hypothetical protein
VQHCFLAVDEDWDRNQAGRLVGLEGYCQHLLNLVKVGVIW